MTTVEVKTRKVRADAIKKGDLVMIDIGYGPHSHEAPVMVTESAITHSGLFGDPRASFEWRYGRETSTAEFSPDQLLDVVE